MYAKIKNQIVEVYPYTITELRKDNPYTSFTQYPTAAELADFNTVIVQQVEQPVISYMQNIAENTPQLINGIWTQVWEVSEASSEQISERLSVLGDQVRQSRNNLLSQSDWTQVADAPVDKQAWAIYRQALRDITSQPGFPTEVTWPTKPE